MSAPQQPAPTTPPPSQGSGQPTTSGQGKAQYVQGWFVSDPQGPHPSHPIAPGGPGTTPPVDPGYGVPAPPTGGTPPSGAHPEHPIVTPPLPGVWPPPGHPAHPIVLPPPAGGGGQPSGPIYIEGSTDKPITSSAGTLHPDLPSGSVPMGKVAILIEVVGVPGKKWLTYETQAQPKPNQTTTPAPAPAK